MQLSGGFNCFSSYVNIVAAHQIPNRFCMCAFARALLSEYLHILIFLVTRFFSGVQFWNVCVCVWCRWMCENGSAKILSPAGNEFNVFLSLSLSSPSTSFCVQKLIFLYAVSSWRTLYFCMRFIVCKNGVYEQTHIQYILYRRLFAHFISLHS